MVLVTMLARSVRWTYFLCISGYAKYLNGAGNKKVSRFFVLVWKQEQFSQIRNNKIYKKMKKVLLTTVMSLMMCMGVFAQTQPDFMKAPKSNEKVLGVITLNFNCSTGPGGLSIYNAYDRLLKKAKIDYMNQSNKGLDIRDLQIKDECTGYSGHSIWTHNCSLYGKVVTISDDVIIRETLLQAFMKALKDVPEGARLAIDRISSVDDKIDKEDYKDQMIDILIDKGYRVVAKEYLQKLYQEQQDQLNSGFYNPDTTVEGSNFSAVGYFISLKVMESSMRVQVVDVSKGEYVGNATVNF